MNKQIFTAILLILCMGLHAQTKSGKMNSYDEQWKEVAAFEDHSLPKSAERVVDVILKQSIDAKNTQQTIKALVYKNKYKIAIDSDDNLGIFTDLENLLNETVNTNEKALLHSMIGELYLKYYNNNRWIIGQRTSLGDYVPDDIKEWPANVFTDKVLSHFDKSMESDVTLLGETSKQYKDIIELGEDADKYYPTLYDFLMERNIALSKSISTTDTETALTKAGISVSDLAVEAKDFVKINSERFHTDKELIPLYYYNRYFVSLLNRNMTETIVLTELSKNSYLYNRLRSDKYRDNVLPLLLQLQDKYKANEISIEIINAIATNYNSYSRITPDSENSDNQAKAYEWYKKGIEMYPGYKRINLLKSSLEAMEKPYARIEGESLFSPGQKDKALKMTYRNLQYAEISISKRVPNVGYQQVKQFRLDLNPKTTYRTETVDLNLDMEAAGTYRIDATFDKKPESNTRSFFYISNLMPLTRVRSDKTYEFYVVDRTTGSPVKGAVVSIAKDKKTLRNLVTDEKGFVSFVTDENINSDYSLRNKYRFQVFTKEDRSGRVITFPYSYDFVGNNSVPTVEVDKKRIDIFTDRSIYRPGQTVYFKAIASFEDKNKAQIVIANQKYKVSLYDVNNQLVSDKELKTNEFGSISGDFVLPRGGLSGGYSLDIDGSRFYFSVEEYKRPTFQITFDKIEKTYTFGDKVVVKGHAENFSGVKLQNATVDYFVTKSDFFRWLSRRTESIDQGSVVTKDDGSFEITFTIPEGTSSGIVPLWRNISSFNITASVTDVNGETQSGDYSFAVGSVSMILTINIPEKLDKKSGLGIEIKATNLDGQEIASASGKYIVCSVLENDSVKEELFRGDFVVGAQKTLESDLKKLPSGKYMVKLQAKDSNGKDVEAENRFILYSVDDKHPPIITNDWFIVKNDKFRVGKDAEIVLGVSSKNATVLYELIQDKKLLEQSQIKFSNENKTFTIPYKSEYGDKITASFTYVIDGVLYQRTYFIQYEKENKDLTLKLEVFRDKLRPGQQEEWRISVKNNEGKPQLTELLASMYDSSLDKIRMYTPWNITLDGNNYYYSPIRFELNNYTTRIGSYFNFKTESYKYPEFAIDRINWFGFDFNNRMIRVRGGGKAVPGVVVQESALTGSSDMAFASVDESVVAGYSVMKQATVNQAVDSSSKLERGYFSLDEASDQADGGQKQDAQPQIRTNFNETAFFYPQLKTDANGETIISFTVPESNTIWKFRALAHDKNLNNGTLEALAVSRKELMVTPNLPRFMRQGDKTSVSTKISNLSENALSGKVRLEFFDPLTDQVLNIGVADKVQSFSIEKDASTSAVWTFDVHADIELIGCRIIAESDNFSDGEQHAISVLPNRMLVTESMAMNVNGGQTKSFEMDKLAKNNSNSLSNYRLTLEYSSNPAWYAIQALPSISTPTSENAISWFASYYANTLSTFIGSQYPKVTATINAWKQQGGTKESLVSNLMDNEELKSVLLEETPWVLDAKNETEQMQRLSLLFDLNNSKQLTTTAISKLQELQNSDGGWSWFKGFYPSRSMTQYILYGFTELITLNAVQYPEEVKRMQMSALKFIDTQIRKDFKDLKKYNKDWEKITSISTNQLEYLYVRSSYRDIPIDQETRAAERFYTSVVEKNWTKLSLYEQSLLAVLTQRNGNKELSSKIMSSIKEHSTTNDEMGMFWANNRSNVFMSMTSISTHVFIMDAFRETKASGKDMDLMKQWLLKQKQTQNWESTHATIDAIYALLSTGSDWFAGNTSATIKVGDKVVKPQSKEIGTGYIKETWSKGEITKDMAAIEVRNPNNGPSYGALYWQYYEDLDKITGQKGAALSVDKKLFVESSTDKGKELNVVSDKNPLKVGDKVVVRLVVKVDRDMEFVHLKDMRASCFEPVETLSGNKWQNGAIYYQSVKDASTNFYFDNLPKGTYAFEYPLYVNRTGEYSNGITTIQCMYAPEFISHTKGLQITVK